MNNTKKVKKQVRVEEELYNKVKGKVYARGSTFSAWLEEQLKKELNEKQRQL